MCCTRTNRGKHRLQLYLGVSTGSRGVSCQYRLLHGFRSVHIVRTHKENRFSRSVYLVFIYSLCVIIVTGPKPKLHVTGNIINN